MYITRPDDWHVHFRDNDILQHSVDATAGHFGRALVMPNLKPPLTSVAAISAYRERIVTACTPRNHAFTPYMTLYLNESVTPDDILDAKKNDFILGAKLYPAGATTNSEAGVTSLKTLYPIFDLMQDNDLVLQIHGEATTGDIFEREEQFIHDDLSTLMKQFPKLRMVLEHISSRAAVDFVKQSPETLAATITPHHLLFNRNDMLVGGIQPHRYCLPVLKHRRDQLALLEAAMSGNPKFFAGTDSAPHARHQKETACGCAGIYSAPFAIPIYAQLFEENNQLNKLNAFLGRFGAQFYHLPESSEHIELIKRKQIVPRELPLGNEVVIPIGAGTTLKWSVHA